MQPDSIPTVPAYDRIVVPLDGTGFAEEALPVADGLCRLFDACLELAGFGVEATDEAELKERLLELAGQRSEAEVSTGVDWDPVDGIMELVSDDERSLVCMAAHARHGVAGALLGSVSAEMLARWQHPILLVGPAVGGVPLQPGPVVVCLDGTAGARSALPAAAGWADRLGADLHVVTAAEPVLPGLPGHHTYRHHGPGDDPVGYVQGVAAMWRTERRRVDGFVLDDPVGVADPVAAYAADVKAALVVVASRPRHGAARAILGSTANDIVRVSPVPVLVVPRID